MLRYKILKDDDGEITIEVDSDGYEVLHNPILNKGSAFSPEERRLFHIDGFLPAAVSFLSHSHRCSNCKNCHYCDRTFHVHASF